ncbi:NAD(P)-dependent alcohol dehydrogenase [bacterium]|nr:NAD(P)-dependent alcohol dehydrogenase [bacterium]
MKAVEYYTYGFPEVLQLKEIEKPVPNDNAILVKLHASSVTATDCIFRQGKPLFARLYTGLFKPKNSRLGDEFAGVVETVGKDVNKFKPGDEVYGACIEYGPWAEYVSLPQEKVAIALKPSTLNFEDSAASVDGFLTALPFLRDTAKIQPGQKVLVNGASGSVGSAAVQVAQILGAEVAGVCSTDKVELVKSLGASQVFDYRREDFLLSGQKWDIIFDTAGNLKFSNCKNVLTPKGTMLLANISLTVFPPVLWTSLFGSKKVKIAATGLRPPAERCKDLDYLRELLEAGSFKPVVDRSFPLDDIVEAHKFVEGGSKRGNVAITIP